VDARDSLHLALLSSDNFQNVQRDLLLLNLPKRCCTLPAASCFFLQLAQRQAQKGAVSFESLSKAIVKALELARLHPHLDARDLLHPAIAELQLSYVDRAVRRMKHVLPDTKLRAELLAKGRALCELMLSIRLISCSLVGVSAVGSAQLNCAAHEACAARHEGEGGAVGQRWGVVQIDHVLLDEG
jgi:hypothetical protein